MFITLPAGEVVLEDWNILINKPDDSQHFVGLDATLGLGRVSTSIHSYNEQSGIGKTESGSNYFTVGSLGIIHSDGIYVLQKAIGDRDFEIEWQYPIKE